MPYVQFFFHYPLLCRAASLAVGFLLALPFLNPASMQQRSSADGSGRRLQADASFGTNLEMVAGSSQDGLDAGSSTSPRMAVMPPMAAVLGEGARLFLVPAADTIRLRHL